MELPGLGIIILLLLGGVVLCWWLSGTAGNARDRARHRTSRAQRLLLTDLDITAGFLPPSEVIDAIVTELDVDEAPALLRRKVYAEQVNPDGVQVLFGNSIVTACSMLVRAVAVERRVRVVVTMDEALGTGGLGPGPRELGRVHDRVTGAVQKLNTAQSADAR